MREFGKVELLAWGPPGRTSECQIPTWDLQKPRKLASKEDSKQRLRKGARNSRPGERKGGRAREPLREQLTRERAEGKGW